MTKWNTAQGQPATTALITSNSGGGSGDQFSLVVGTFATFDNMPGPLHGGTRAYHIVVTTAANQESFNYSSLNNDRGAAQAYIWWNTLPSAAQQIMQIRSAAQGAILAIDVTNHWVVQNAVGTSISTFPTAFTTGKWYRCEMESIIGALTTNGTINARISLGDSTTPIDTPYASGATVNSGTANFTDYKFSKLSGVGTMDAWWRDIRVNNGSTVPLGPAVPIASPKPINRSALVRASSW